MNYTLTVAEAVLASHQVKEAQPDRSQMNYDPFADHIATRICVVMNYQVYIFAAMNCSASNKDAVDVDVEQEFLFLDLKLTRNHRKLLKRPPESENRLLIECDHGRQRSAPLTASNAGSEHVGSSSVKLQGICLNQVYRIKVIAAREPRAFYQDQKWWYKVMCRGLLKFHVVASKELEMRKVVEELSVLTDKYKEMEKELADSGMSTSSMGRHLRKCSPQLITQVESLEHVLHTDTVMSLSIDELLNEARRNVGSLERNLPKKAVAIKEAIKCKEAEIEPLVKVEVDYELLALYENVGAKMVEDG
ncbi:hypothetical protein Tco_0079915 [Tanacetum coccineum]